MSQHFLLTAAARTVSLKQILRMKEAETWAMFCSIRWPETDGAPVCPHCGCPTCWACPRPTGAPRFRCSACRRDFSPTSGTLFAFHKLEIRDYLAAVVIFCDEVKGKAALALSRDLDVQYKTAFVLAHKIREAMASEVKDLRLGGAGRHVLPADQDAVLDPLDQTGGLPVQGVANQLAQQFRRPGVLGIEPAALHHLLGDLADRQL
jgi:transposase-like protein